MENILSFLNKYSQLLLILITTIYVFLTYKILKNIKKEREDRMRPYIHIREYLKFSFIECLLIKNVGKTAAKNVSFQLDKDIYQYGDTQRNIKDLSLFKEGVKFFPPEAEYHINLAQYQLFFKEDRDRNENVLPLIFKITSTYSYDIYGFKKNTKTVKEETIIDIKSTYKTNIPSNEIANEIKELRSEISKFMKKK